MTSRNQPGDTTFVAERMPRRSAIVVTALYSVGVVWPLVAVQYRLGTDKCE